MNKWPKILATLTPEQQIISHDFMQFWHEQLATKSHYNMIEKFNHGYAVKHAPNHFLRTLEIGAGLGEHLHYERLTADQKRNYIALELKENMAAKIKENHPDIITHIGDCQQKIDFPDHYFDRILAIHVLEHLPNLPAAVREMYRLCKNPSGRFSIVIPCEGGFAYQMARKISAQRLFQQRYQQSYQWFIEREHINKPNEILEELRPYFNIKHKQFFPFALPIIHINLCIGLTLQPK